MKTDENKGLNGGRANQPPLDLPEVIKNRGTGNGKNITLIVVMIILVIVIAGGAMLWQHVSSSGMSVNTSAGDHPTTTFGK